MLRRIPTWTGSTFGDTTTSHRVGVDRATGKEVCYKHRPSVTVWDSCGACGIHARGFTCPGVWDLRARVFGNSDFVGLHFQLLGNLQLCMHCPCSCDNSYCNNHCWAVRTTRPSLLVLLLPSGFSSLDSCLSEQRKTKRRLLQAWLVGRNLSVHARNSSKRQVHTHAHNKSLLHDSAWEG